MNRRLTRTGASLLILAVLLPMVFFLLSLIGVELIEGLLIGIDWFCCMGWSALILIAGLIVLIIGLRTD